MVELPVRWRFVDCSNERIMQNPGWEMKQDLHTSRQGGMKEKKERPTSINLVEGRKGLKKKASGASMTDVKHNMIRVRRNPGTIRSDEPCHFYR